MSTSTAAKRRSGRKRGNGEGSVYQRANGIWVGALMLGRTATGRPDRRFVYGRTRAEVQRKLDELRTRAATGLVTEPHQLTVATYLTQWLRDSVALHTREKTQRTYAVLVRRHILPAIGAVKLTGLRPAHLQALYAAMTATGYASATVRLTHGLLVTALKQAVAWGYLPRNPADAARPPTLRRTEMQTLDAEQVRRLLATAAAAGDRWLALWHLLVDSGARIGEALALTWADLDLDRGTVTVRRTLMGVAADGAPRTGEPKTARARRTVTLMPTTVAALRAHRARQGAERLACGPDYAGHNLVFCTPIGTAAAHGTVLTAFRAALRRAGLPETVRLHDLRHTSATLMLAAGVNPRVAADRLGHASVAMTLTIYSHVTPSTEADAAARLARVLGGSGG